jgi:hypothetical protein
MGQEQRALAENRGCHAQAAQVLGQVLAVFRVVVDERQCVRKHALDSRRAIVMNSSCGALEEKITIGAWNFAVGN